MITNDMATYVYTGIETNYNLGPINITPSFTPGFYRQGNGKDLGHPLEFKSEVQLSLDLSGVQIWECLITMFQMPA